MVEGATWCFFPMVTCICECNQPWFSEVFLSPCSDFHNRIVSVYSTKQCPLGPEDDGHWVLFFCFALFLAYMDFSGLCESFEDIMCCRGWNPQIHCNFTLRSVLKLMNYLLIQSFSGEPLTCERLAPCLFGKHYTASSLLLVPFQHFWNTFGIEFKKSKK